MTSHLTLVPALDMTAFRVGETYTTLGGTSYVWTFVVVKRTAKFITIEDTLSGKVRRVGVYDYRGVEHALPHGNHSMAPVLSADTVAA